MIPRYARISRKLRRGREPSMYGDEESGISPEELYDAEDSREALSWTIEVLESVSKLFKELTSQEPI